MEEQNKEKKVLIITEENNLFRLDAFLSEELTLSRSQIKKLILAGEITVNKLAVKPSEKLKTGDQVVVRKTAVPLAVTFSPRPVELDIMYEDDQIIAINKKPGLVVHPGAGTTSATLAEGLFYYLKGSVPQNADNDLRPGIVHRLDKDTSGVIICAKTPAALTKLSQQFAAKETYKEYLALIAGHLKEDYKQIISYLGRHQTKRQQYRSLSREEYLNLDENKQAQFKHAHSEIYVVDRYSIGEWQATLVKVVIKTGRTHQIRVHCKAIGHPVLRDHVYGNSSVANIPEPLKGLFIEDSYQLLHARILGINHPETKEQIAFEADIPDNFSKILRNLKP